MIHGRTKTLHIIDITVTIIMLKNLDLSPCLLQEFLAVCCSQMTCSVWDKSVLWMFCCSPATGQQQQLCGGFAFHHDGTIMYGSVLIQFFLVYEFRICLLFHLCHCCAVLNMSVGGGWGWGGVGVIISVCYPVDIRTHIIKLRWSQDCLIFIMGISIFRKTFLYKIRPLVY